jgi:hypothetical protein
MNLSNGSARPRTISFGSRIRLWGFAAEDEQPVDFVQSAQLHLADQDRSARAIEIQFRSAGGSLEHVGSQNFRVDPKLDKVKLDSTKKAWRRG